MPKIIELEQGTPAWHEFRLRHVGASEAATILNVDPFGKKPFGLWMEKTGRKKASTYQNDTQKHGHENEEAARMGYIEYAGEFAIPTVMECTRDGWEFMSASLDGLHANGKTVVEIKCPVEAGTWREVREGTIGDHYYSQIQHQLFVSEADKAHFYCWFKGEGICVSVELDEPYLATELLPAVEQFWKRCMSNTWPMPTGEIELKSPEFKAWAVSMADVIAMEREIKDKRLKLEAQGSRAFFKNYKRITGHGIEVAFTFKPGYTERKPRTVSDSLSMTIRRTE